MCIGVPKAEWKWWFKENIEILFLNKMIWSCQLTKLIMCKLQLKIRQLHVKLSTILVAKEKFAVHRNQRISVLLSALFAETLETSRREINNVFCMCVHIPCLHCRPIYVHAKLDWCLSSSFLFFWFPSICTNVSSVWPLELSS